MRSVTPIKTAIIADLMEGGDNIVNGIIIIDDNMKERGIRPRWCRIYEVGSEITDLKKGDWILVDHGRWSHGFKDTFDGQTGNYRWIDYKDVLLAQDEMPEGIVTI